MTGWILQILSVIVVTAVAGSATAKVICWLPCAVGDRTDHAGLASHCAQTEAGGTERLTGVDRGCAACDQLRLADADRLTSRHSLPVGVSLAAGFTANLPSGISASHLRWRADMPPGRRSSAPVPLPLRI